MTLINQAVQPVVQFGKKPTQEEFQELKVLLAERSEIPEGLMDRITIDLVDIQMEPKSFLGKLKTPFKVIHASVRFFKNTAKQIRRDEPVVAVNWLKVKEAFTEPSVESFENGSFVVKKDDNLILLNDLA